MITKDKSPQYLTSVELEEAIQHHREQVKKLLAEARARRRATTQEQEALDSTKPIE